MTSVNDNQEYTEARENSTNEFATNLVNDFLLNGVNGLCIQPFATIILEGKAQDYIRKHMIMTCFIAYQNRKNVVQALIITALSLVKMFSTHTNMGELLLRNCTSMNDNYIELLNSRTALTVAKNTNCSAADVAKAAMLTSVKHNFFSASKECPEPTSSTTVANTASIASNITSTSTTPPSYTINNLNMEMNDDDSSNNNNNGNNNNNSNDNSNNETASASTNEYYSYGHEGEVIKEEHSHLTKLAIKDHPNLEKWIINYYLRLSKLKPCENPADTDKAFQAGETIEGMVKGGELKINNNIYSEYLKYINKKIVEHNAIKDEETLHANLNKYKLSYIDGYLNSRNSQDNDSGNKLKNSKKMVKRDKILHIINNYGPAEFYRYVVACEGKNY